MSATDTRSPDAAADDLLRSLVRDLLPHLRIDQVMDSWVGSADGLLAWWSRWTGPGDPPRARSPEEVWTEIRDRYPRAAVFPLGTVAERALRRVVMGLLGPAPDGDDAAVRAALRRVSASRLMHRYLSLLLFEAALLDLRGSSDQVHRDYGFWYHWRPDGALRSLEEEAELRARLWRACLRRGAALLRAWVERRPGPACPRDEDLDAALRDVFELGPAPRRRRLRRPAVTVLGLRPDAETTARHGPIAYDAREIVVDGTGANVRLDDRELLAACGGTLDGRLRDLIEIAVTFYLADIYVPRGTLFERDLVVLMPVRNPELWSRNAAAIERPVSFLVGNTVRFRFVAGAAGRGRSVGDLRVDDDGRCVALFSGGLDSFVGAALAVAEGREPVLLSHAPSPALLGLQRRLLARLRGTGETPEAVVVQAGAEHRQVASMDRLGRPPEQDLYQHGRSFLFLSLAAAVALSRRIGRIHVCENGPVALNPSFSEARFNTRTTHPVFFALFERLIEEVFGVHLAIVDPFELKTKGEVVELLPEDFHRDLRATNSCWSYAHVKPFAADLGIEKFSGGHCGRCVPCVWRRAAVRRAKLAELDDTYLWDVVPDHAWDRWLDRRHFTVLLDLYRSCWGALEAPSDQALLDLCPDLAEIGPGSLADRLDLQRRHAQEIVDWFHAAAAKLVYRLD